MGFNIQTLDEDSHDVQLMRENGSRSELSFQ